MRSAFGNSSFSGPSSSSSNNPPAVNHHIFTSVLAHSNSGGAGGRGPRHFDVLARRNAQQQQQNTGTVSKDQALADHQLQTIVRLKGANIVRQRLVFLMRQKFSKEFSHLNTLQQQQQASISHQVQPTPTTNPSDGGDNAAASAAVVDVPSAPPARAEPTPLQQALLWIEEMIISADNTDVENAGYLRNFAKSAHKNNNNSSNSLGRHPLEPQDVVPHQQPLVGGGGGGAGVRTSSLTSPSSRMPATPTTTMTSGGALSCQCICSSCGAKKIPGASASASGSSRIGALGVASSASAPLLSNDRMLSLGTPSFILQAAAFGGVPLATESRFGIAGSAVVSQSPSEVSCSSAVDDDDDDDLDDEDDTDVGDDRAAAALVPDGAEEDADKRAEAVRKQEEIDAAEGAAAGMSGLRGGAFYEMRVKRVLGTGTVCCPKCLNNLSDVPATPVVVCADASTNTAERSESEKDYMLASLTKAKADSEKKMDEMKKELQAFKKAKYASQNLATPSASTTSNSASPQLRATPQKEDPGPLPLHESIAMGSMSPTRASTPGPGGAAGDDVPLPTLRSSSSVQLRGSPSGRHGVGASPASRAGARVGTRRPAAAVDISSEALFSPSSTTLGGDASSPLANHAVQQRLALTLRLQNSVRELRVKLNALRAGIRSFQFKEVIGQFSQHVVPQLQQVQSTNKRLLDRDYILEKLLLDALCKVGTMPDAGSPEGYLPEGGPLHIGTYSLLDDRRFLEWTRRISETLSGKVTAVQSYIQTLSNEVKLHQPNPNTSGKGPAGAAAAAAVLEDRVVALEGSLVENECFNVSNILDHTFDSSTAVQGTRRTELVTLLKHAAETNEEIRLIYVVPNWATKPQLRVKLNMWRQRRLEALQKVEQLLSQELQHFVSSGAQKIMLKGKLMTVRELIQLASRLHLMPSSSTTTKLNALTTSGSSQSLLSTSAQRPSQLSPPPSSSGGSHHQVSLGGSQVLSPVATTPPTQPFVKLSVDASSPSVLEDRTFASSALVQSLGSLGASPSVPLLPPSLMNGGMHPSSSATLVDSGSPLANASAVSAVLSSAPVVSSHRFDGSNAPSPPSSSESGQQQAAAGNSTTSAGSPVTANRRTSSGNKLPPVK